MKKRFLVLALAASMAISMTACGGSDSSSSETTTETAEEEVSDTSEESAEESAEAEESEESATEEVSADEETVGGEYEDSDWDWEECTLDDISEKLGVDIKLPEDTTFDDTSCRWFTNTEIGEFIFHSDSEDFTLRAKKASAFEEITDLMYENYESEEDCQVCGKYEGVDRRVSEGGTCYDSIQWYDSDAGIMYSLTAIMNSYDGFDIQAYADQISE